VESGLPAEVEICSVWRRVTALDDLLKQARWWRFVDQGMEQQFHEERQRDGLMRVRVMLALAILFVTAIGLRMALVFPPGTQWQLADQLHYRFFVAAPAWLLALGSTMWPGHTRRAEWVYAGATLVVIWGLVVMNWLWLLQAPPGLRAPVSAITLDFIEVLVLSTFTLPLRVRWQAVLSVGSAAGALGFLAVAMPSSLARELGSLTTNLGFAAVATLVLAAWRERGERALFVQREYGRVLNAELEKTNGELARLNAEKNEFMAVAAHDLRAPLGVVRGLLELVRDGKIVADEKRAEAVRQALGEAQRMHTLVDDYLGAHALESGAVPVRLARLDLGAAAQAAGVRHAGAAEKKGQRIDVEAPAGKVWVMADAGMMAQVADNFVTNALKFSPAGATVRLELFVTEAGAGKGAARLAVTDEGPGISAEEQGRLFVKFGKGRARATAGEASTGLGLAVAKRLAEAMGCAVGCESPANGRGTGATFWLVLPQAGEAAV
jgi:signal transduction histidine kinase